MKQPIFWPKHSTVYNNKTLIKIKTHPSFPRYNTETLWSNFLQLFNKKYVLSFCFSSQSVLYFSALYSWFFIIFMCFTVFRAVAPKLFLSAAFSLSKPHLYSSLKLFTHFTVFWCPLLDPSLESSHCPHGHFGNHWPRTCDTDIHVTILCCFCMGLFSMIGLYCIYSLFSCTHILADRDTSHTNICHEHVHDYTRKRVLSLHMRSRYTWYSRMLECQLPHLSKFLLLHHGRNTWLNVFFIWWSKKLCMIVSPSKIVSCMLQMTLYSRTSTDNNNFKNLLGKILNTVCGPFC